MATDEILALERLNARRREAERRLTDLRTSIDRELGILAPVLAPKKAFWIAPLVAFAGGLAMALIGRRRGVAYETLPKPVEEESPGGESPPTPDAP